MAFTVSFYTFSKKVNSTAQPSNPVITVSCSLKDNSGVLNPVLEIDMTNNPGNLNYCYIQQFSRYYWVNDWTWILGRWEVSLTVDAMATYRTQIGNSTHYVLRSSYRYNPNIVDNMYPALAWEPDFYTYTADFQWADRLSYGTFVLGVVNKDSGSYGAVSYYTMSYSNIRNLVDAMLPDASQTWTQGFTQMTDILYRSIYGAYDYIKSCKWFPFSTGSMGGDLREIAFGNYRTSDIYPTSSSIAYGNLLPNTFSSWYVNTRDLYLPSSWLSQDAKYRTNPNAHIYIIFNPWGVIEINPIDMSNTRQLRLRFYVDLISGDGLLKIYKVVGTTEYQLTQLSTKISVDINLSQTSIDVGGIVSGIAGTATSAISALSSGGIAPMLTSAITAGASAQNALNSAIPTMSGSVGQTATSMVTMDGTATLYYQYCYYADEDNTENGKPLCENMQLNTIPGYIKCLHGETAISGAYDEELNIINDNLTNGFFYE